MDKKITFNEKTYSSIEDMPAGVGEKYQRMLSKFADTNLNGIPDIFEGGSGDVNVVSSSKVLINGKEYSSLGDLPDFARRAFERVIDLKPDTYTTQDHIQQHHTVDGKPIHLHNDPQIVDQIPVSETMQESSSNSRFLILLVAIAGIVLFFLVLFAQR